MSAESFLTPRELVSELDRLGVGAWSADAPQKWLRETPSVAVASPSTCRGSANLFRVRDVMAWLLDREQRYQEARGKALNAGMAGKIEATIAKIEAELRGEREARDFSRRKEDSTPPSNVSARPPASDEALHLTLERLQRVRAELDGEDSALMTLLRQSRERRRVIGEHLSRIEGLLRTMAVPPSAQASLPLDLTS